MLITHRAVYLDHAAVSALPAPTAQEMAQFATEAAEQGGFHWPQWASKVQRTRAFAARMIGCHDSEICLIPNTTHGINLIALGFPWRSGDNVVVPENEFPSNLLPWKNLSHLGVETRLVPVDESGSVTAESIESVMDQRTRLVSISWVGFASGYRCRLAEIADLVHSRDAYLFVDAIQGLGAFALDVNQLGIDFLAADGHKWMMGPEGAGLLYIRQSHLDLLRPLNLGWNSLESGGFDPRSERLKETSARYEGGSTNMAGMLGFGRSLNLLLRNESNQSGGIFERTILENVAQLEDHLRTAGYGADIPEKEENRSGILGVRWPEAESGGEQVYLRARKFLMNRGILVSVRGGRLRVSTHAYNNRDDHLQFVQALDDFRKHNH